MPHRGDIARGGVAFSADMEAGPIPAVTAALTGRAMQALACLLRLRSVYKRIHSPSVGFGFGDVITARSPLLSPAQCYHEAQLSCDHNGSRSAH